MKKKILIVIVAVAMMIPLLAVGVCADYSPETGWSDPDRVVDGGFSVLIRTVVNGNEVSDVPSVLYGYLIMPDMTTLDVGSLPLDSTVLSQDYEWYYCTNAVSNETVAFRAKGLRVSNTGVTYANMYINESIGWQEQQIDAGNWMAFMESYPPSATEAGLQFFGAFEFEVIRYNDPRSPFLALIELMFDNFSRIIGGLAAGITGAFTALIWENPEATEKSLSTLAKFIFTIAGLSIGMTVFYLVLRLIRFGRQR